MDLDDQMDRCYYRYCQQREFLPFQCQLCKLKYCTEHKDPQQHECQHQVPYKQVYICNSCQKTIQYMSNQDIQALIESHNIICPNKKKEIDKCLKCKIKLSQLNKYECKQCGQLVCLQHRFSEDHDCKKSWCIIM